MDVILEFIYKKYYKEIRYHIFCNSGCEDDAKDIFQEALIIIYRRVKENDLMLTCSFNTFLFAVCNRLWLKQLKKRNPGNEIINDMGSESVDNDFMNIFEESTRNSLFQKHFEKLEKDCKRILTLFLKNLSVKEIAEQMGYKSEGYAKKRKYLCKEYLVNNIKNDPLYKELIT